MTIQEFERLEQELKDAGYRRYNAPIINNTFYYCKGFGYCKDEHGETYPKYQVLFLVWDFTIYQQIPESHKFGIEVQVIPKFNSRNDLVLTRDSYNIEEIENIAKSFYEFAETFLKD